MKSNKPTYNGITFDSNDEIQFYKWCVEAQELGVISGFQFHPKSMNVIHAKSYIVSEEYITPKRKEKRTRHKSMSLMQSLDYTPDFILHDAKGVLFKVKYQDDGVVTIDIKPAYDLHKNSSKFSMLQKMILEAKGLYVHKVIVEKFFKANGVPSTLKRFRKKDGVEIGKWTGWKTIEEILKEKENETD